MTKNIQFRYASHTNISFHGEVDSGYTPEEWAELSETEQGEAMTEALWELVEMSAVEDE